MTTKETNNLLKRQKQGGKAKGGNTGRPIGGAAIVVPPPCRVTGIKTTYSVMYSWYLVILCILQTFISLPTVSVCVHFYFIAIPLFVICWVFCSVCIIGKSLIFLLLWKWMIFDLLKKKFFCGFCLTTQINFSLWKGLAKRSARI